MQNPAAQKPVNLLQYLDPATLSSISNLDLIARLVVEGFITGLHKSPFHGFSVEFSQHRPYMSGDSLRFVDWKVYGRTDRFYIKQYEEETNLKNYIILDISKSMQYSSGGISKAQYASYLSAALAFLLIQQRDATGLVLFDDQIRQMLPPRSVYSYLNRIFASIQNAEYGTDTNLSTTLHQVAERLNRRGMVILISDLLDDPDDVLAGLKHFRHNKQEVLVFHIIDEQELNFDFSGEVLFEDMESGQKIKTQANYIRDEYRKHFTGFLDNYKKTLNDNRIDYQLLSTSTPYNIALNEYLLKRKRLF